MAKGKIEIDVGCYADLLVIAYQARIMYESSPNRTGVIAVAYHNLAETCEFIAKRMQIQEG